ncbi:MAG: VTT domain-containing protein, partial [Propionicimonas sp.]|nr:VTT domain-containing protein [Propionicimonas sp.]
MFVIVFCRAGGTYWLGRLAAAGVRHTRIARLLDGAAYQTAARRINAYGAPVVALSFLTIGFQTVANFTAGATLMPLTRYLPALAVGGLAWALLYSTLGTVGVNLLGRLWDVSPGLAIGVGAAIVAGRVGFARWGPPRPRAAGTPPRA